MKDIPCFVVGNAPSLADQPIKNIEKYFSIGMNRLFRVLDPTILIWQDIELWITERKFLPQLDAVKYCRITADPENIAYHFRLTTGGYKLPRDPLTLHGRGSTGPLAFQLAYLLGCNPLVFVGYDCKYRGDKTDFWGRNKFHKPHSLKNCSRGLHWIKKINERECHLSLINCSENDILGQQISLPEAIKQVKDMYQETGRPYLLSKLFKFSTDSDTSLKNRRIPK